MLSAVTTLHVVLAAVFGAVAVAVGALGLAGYAGAGNRLVLDRLILVAIITGAAAALLGVAPLAVGRAPSDPLHFLYGAIAVAGLPVARYAARRVSSRRLSLVLAVVALALLGVLVRLWQTG